MIEPGPVIGSKTEMFGEPVIQVQVAVDVEAPRFGKIVLQGMQEIIAVSSIPFLEPGIDRLTCTVPGGIERQVEISIIYRSVRDCMYPV